MEPRVLEALYLIDAVATETNTMKLKLLDNNGKIREFTEDKYKPYFLTGQPLTKENAQIVERFSGSVGNVEKTDLYTHEKRILAKVSWPNMKIAAKAADEFTQCWESEIDFPRSYVYDRGMVFGALHSGADLKPILNAPSDMGEEFEKTFKNARENDPMKFAQISYWFNLLSQPVPSVSFDLLGNKEADPEKVHSAWMLSRIANIPVREALSSHRVSDWLKSIIYTHMRKNDFLIPTPKELTRGKPAHTVAGALTFSPKAGTYFNTIVCDFESLYASCIDSFNLSYETVDCPHPQCQENKIPDSEGHVCTLHRGLYSVLIGALKELRIKLFKPASKDTTLTEERRKAAVAAAKLLKLILVSSYGVTIRIHGLACPPLAEAITGYGRYALKESWHIAEDKGMQPLYGDTDSLFLNNPSNEQVKSLIKTVREKLRLDLVIDKHYSLCVLPKAKKAYFGILSDGTPDIKGVTAVKSNSPGYVNRVFQQCISELSTVRNMEGFTQATKNMKELVRQAIADVTCKRINLEDLTYSVKLYFDPNEKIGDMKTAHQPYQCALQLLETGKKLKKGDIVSFIKVRPFKHQGRTFTVKPKELVTSLGEVNTEDYVRNLLTALNQAFQPMGIQLETGKVTEISKWFPS